MRPTLPTYAELNALPEVYRVVIPERYRDLMGHMNIRWYLELYDEAGVVLFEQIGLTEAHYRENQAGGFDLEHHLHYLNEVHIGDTVVITARLLARGPKRLHYQLYMLNETRELRAATFECVNSYADLRTRKTAPYPPEIAAQIDTMLRAQQALAWPAPVCGVMGV